MTALRDYYLSRPNNLGRVSMKKAKVEKKSWGTEVAEKARAKANGFSQQKRQRLMARGMQLIYGDAHARTTVHRRGH